MSGSRGSVALVTGASRGIGRALAVRLHQAGMRVAATARSAEALDALAAELGGDDVLALPGDVTDQQAVTTVVETAERVLGPIDLLVNNAGAAEPRETTLWEADPEAWWGTITTNVLGPMLYIRAVAPGMLARGSGRIVNVNSLLGVWTLPTQTAYGVSKAALGKLTASLSAGLAGTGVLAFDYSPGRVRTDLTSDLGDLPGARDDSWTSMEQAVDGVLAIAHGRLDALAGRFIHARDDLDTLTLRAAEITARGGRVVSLTEAFDGDPLSRR
ncbi:SDR family NAD(P)-dependent oxidoreductase [Nonomuraea sp. NPDC048826]|uniref:SDR family NAD(P)-dependent oxidoreductase n=1 Tax=Nonomuraea sp. NPDC048826 TaxID=3364347 RepID=UPI00371BCF02